MHVSSCVVAHRSLVPHSTTMLTVGCVWCTLKTVSVECAVCVLCVYYYSERQKKCGVTFTLVDPTQFHELRSHARRGACSHMFSPDTVVWAEKLLTGTPDTSRPHAPPPCVRVQRELPRGPHVSRRPSNHSSPHLYTSHPHRLPASPPSGPPDTSRHYSSSQVPIRVYLAHTPHLPLPALVSRP